MSRRMVSRARINAVRHLARDRGAAALWRARGLSLKDREAFSTCRGRAGWGSGWRAWRSSWYTGT